MSVRLPIFPSVRVEQLGSHWVFREILNLGVFRISVHKIQVSLKSDKNCGDFTCRPIDIDILRMRNISDKFRHKLKTLILCQITDLRNSCHL